MSSLKVATKADQAWTLPILLTERFHRQRSGLSLDITYHDAEMLEGHKGPAAAQLERDGGQTYDGTVNVLHGIIDHEAVSDDARAMKQRQLEAEWVDRSSQLAPANFGAIEGALRQLESHLMLRSYIVGYDFTYADIAIWGTLRGNRAAYGFIKKDHLINVGRWFRFVEESWPWVTEVVDEFSVQIKERKAVKAREGASYEIALPETEKGVVTRFPPEPSGYLHLGHAKAALLNDYFAHGKYNGTLILRFDDTNPSKEKVEFEDAIVEDLAMMAVVPDRTSHTSDYFGQLCGYCEVLIKNGRAYADDTEQATMRDQRMKGLPSQRRDRSVVENLDMFQEMLAGSATGVKHCIRAKISVGDPNKAMRDPVIYRCNPVPHHRTGDTWKAYPTYDFCCPIVDALEGVTHALRTSEYRDRNPQYQWMLDAVGLRPVHIWDFSRLNFIRTLLSKRKLTRFVEDGLVWGWDDPRMPTVRGIRRRGMTIPALREFILRQGPSRNVVNLDWTIFWATNKRHIDPIAPRHTAVVDEKVVKAHVVGAPREAYTEDKPRHGKNDSLGTKKVVYSPFIILDQDDAKSFTDDEEITLMNWGNAFVRKITRSGHGSGGDDVVTDLELELHLSGDVKQTDKKVTWLSVDGPKLIPVQLVEFDHLITKDKLDEDDRVDDFLTHQTIFRTEARADHNVSSLDVDDIIQFERKGYFRLDRPWNSPGHGHGHGDGGAPAIFFQIPTGKTGK